MSKVSTYRLVALASVTLLSLALCFFPLTAQAQTTGTIYGRVVDPSGAAVVGATVSVTNLDTSLERSVTTQSEGNYSFTLLPVGTYKITSRAAGFEAYLQSGIVLQVASNVHADISMKIGEITQEINVQGVAPQVDTASATLGKVMEETRIEDLPLNGRNFLQLAVLQPGVVPPVPGIASQGAGTTHTPGGT